jgi:hypothetical protein
MARGEQLQMFAGTLTELLHAEALALVRPLGWILK